MLDLIGSREITAATYATLANMAEDPVNKPRLMTYLQDATAPRVELRTVVRALARVIQPRRYLEIGVRLGWSMAQVAAECPTCEIVGIDPWIPAYAKADNPGSDFVCCEIAHAAPLHRGGLRILEGFSREWLPRGLGTFDLITVDGDHTGGGAWHDLYHCLPMLTPGGALVFDDLLDTSDNGKDATLRMAWERARQEFSGFTWHEFAGLVPVGVAIHD